MAEMRSREEAKKGGRGRSSGGGVENGERTAGSSPKQAPIPVATGGHLRTTPSCTLGAGHHLVVKNYRDKPLAPAVCRERYPRARTAAGCLAGREPCGDPSRWGSDLTCISPAAASEHWQPASYSSVPAAAQASGHASAKNWPIIASGWRQRRNFTFVVRRARVRKDA